MLLDSKVKHVLVKNCFSLVSLPKYATSTVVFIKYVLTQMYSSWQVIILSWVHYVAQHRNL